MPEPPIHNFGDLAFTPSVRAVQAQRGSRPSNARMEAMEFRTGLTEDEVAFIQARDSFYLATVGENGWPYVQHRGGPRGFLRVLGQNELGFADLRGNRQYITAGNLNATGRACLFLMDYPNQARLKLWAEARVTEDPAELARLRPLEIPEKLVERGILLRVLAFDWNCSQYITPRYTAEEWAEHEAGGEPGPG
jgi:predicted pyridoxine 5'-phosphate oxidase superfamily flavin-nucleotide-binding protein